LDTHKWNLAERAIQTFKSHFIAILAGVDPTFTMNLWDHLVPQAVLTLNLLGQSNVATTMSAYQHVNGPFDYNKMPIVPLGCAVQMHKSTNRRRTWDPHSLSGWYLGTLPEHYWCHNIFCRKTQSEQISNTVFFQHCYITRPVVTLDDQIIKAVSDLKLAILQRISVKGGEEMETLQKLNDILNNVKSSEVAVKKVTFSESIPESRVGKRGGNLQ
jgi:hypothetical protein